MKILQLVRSLDVGGLEVMVLNLTRQLLADGHEVDICCVEQPGALATDPIAVAGINVSSLDKGLGFKPSIIGRLATQLRRGAYDVLHSHNPLAHFYGALATARVPTCRAVHTKHQMYRSQSLKQRFQSRLATRFTHRLVGVSDAVTHSAKAECWVRKRHALTIHNGLALDQYLATPVGLRSTQEPPCIGTIGRLSSIKNQQLLLQAVAALQGRGRSVQLLLVGDGSQRETLEERSRSLGIVDQIEFAGYRSDTDQQLQRMDVFALPSLSEGMPLVLIEAMAAGKPIIASAVGGVAAMLAQGDCGLLLSDNHSAEELADKIEYCLDSPSVAKQLGQAARQRAVQEYSVAKMASAYLEVYSTAS